MGRPLWSLSVSELGTTPKELEQTLFKVLDIAAAWKAVLLLDEADVYLEKRVTGADLTRNAMTGIFLRMLEYYHGVLFLTTNRIETFDEAFGSRISMFLFYSTLSTQHKEKIWKSLLEKAGVQNVGSEKLSELAALKLNGREIRNAIHTAQSLAQNKGQDLELEHVQHVIMVLSKSLASLTEVLERKSV
jgi:SpoVK/Ycf46/Vps4 family AAA+-type ATPase